jgi:hypothetical protein
MAFNHDDFVPFGKQGKTVKIRMAIQAHVIVIEDGFFEVIGSPHKSFIAVWVMTFPAGKFLYIVNAFLVFHLYVFKVILGIGLIITMAVQALKLFLKTGLDAMGKYIVIVGVAVVAAKRVMLS